MRRCQQVVVLEAVEPGVGRDHQFHRHALEIRHLRRPGSGAAVDGLCGRGAGENADHRQPRRRLSQPDECGAVPGRRAAHVPRRDRRIPRPGVQRDQAAAALSGGAIRTQRRESLCVRWCWLVLGILAWLLPSGGSFAAPPPAPPAPVTLTRGINITGWFRFPVSRDPVVLAAYLSDQALADIRAAGFDFVRLAVDPAVAETQRSVLIAAIGRIQRQGLTVVVSPQPHDWHLETDPDDRERLLVFWRALALALRTLDPARTVPEVLNEPVFPHDPAGWAALQHQVLTIIRQALPSVTVVLTGQDWGSIGGLLDLTPEADPNVVYSVHFYDPAELTSLAAYRPGLDRA